jgi:hypothetical protein
VAAADLNQRSLIDVEEEVSYEDEGVAEVSNGGNDCFAWRGGCLEDRQAAAPAARRSRCRSVVKVSPL